MESIETDKELQGLRVALSAVIPIAEMESTRDRETIRFVGLLSRMVFEGGGTIMQVFDPIFSAVVAGQARNFSLPDGAKPMTIVVSQDQAENFGAYSEEFFGQVAEIVADDPETTGPMSLPQRSLVKHADILIVVGSEEFSPENAQLRQARMAVDAGRPCYTVCVGRQFAESVNSLSKELAECDDMVVEVPYLYHRLSDAVAEIKKKREVTPLLALSRWKARKLALSTAPVTAAPPIKEKSFASARMPDAGIPATPFEANPREAFLAGPVGAKRGPSPRGNRSPRNRVNEEKISDLLEKVVDINRCAKVVKGGRRFSYSAMVIAGDGKGHVGCKSGKAKEVAVAINKATHSASKHMTPVALRGPTIPHEVIGHFGAARILLLPASPGTGLKIGGAARAVVAAAGIKDLIGKSLGSRNRVNLVKATMDGLSQLRLKEQIDQTRGKSEKNRHAFKQKSKELVPA